MDAKQGQQPGGNPLDSPPTGGGDPLELTVESLRRSTDETLASGSSPLIDRIRRDYRSAVKGLIESRREISKFLSTVGKYENHIRQFCEHANCLREPGMEDRDRLIVAAERCAATIASHLGIGTVDLTAQAYTISRLPFTSNPTRGGVLENLLSRRENLIRKGAAWIEEDLKNFRSAAVSVVSCVEAALGRLTDPRNGFLGPEKTLSVNSGLTAIRIAAGINPESLLETAKANGPAILTELDGIREIIAEKDPTSELVERSYRARHLQPIVTFLETHQTLPPLQRLLVQASIVHSPEFGGADASGAQIRALTQSIAEFSEAEIKEALKLLATEGFECPPKIHSRMCTAAKVAAIEREAAALRATRAAAEASRVQPKAPTGLPAPAPDTAAPATKSAGASAGGSVTDSQFGEIRTGLEADGYNPEVCRILLQYVLRNGSGPCVGRNVITAQAIKNHLPQRVTNYAEHAAEFDAALEMLIARRGLSEHRKGGIGINTQKGAGKAPADDSVAQLIEWVLQNPVAEYSTAVPGEAQAPKIEGVAGPGTKKLDRAETTLPPKPDPTPQPPPSEPSPPASAKLHHREAEGLVRKLAAAVHEIAAHTGKRKASPKSENFEGALVEIEPLLRDPQTHEFAKSISKSLFEAVKVWEATKVPRMFDLTLDALAKFASSSGLGVQTMLQPLSSNEQLTRRAGIFVAVHALPHIYQRCAEHDETALVGNVINGILDSISKDSDPAVRDDLTKQLILRSAAPHALWEAFAKRYQILQESSPVPIQQAAAELSSKGGDVSEQVGAMMGWLVAGIRIHPTFAERERRLEKLISLAQEHPGILEILGKRGDIVSKSIAAGIGSLPTA